VEGTQEGTTFLTELDKQRLTRARLLVGVLRNLEYAEHGFLAPIRIYQEQRSFEEIRKAFDSAREALGVFLDDIGDPDTYDIPF
jgi:hypothetical protein